MPSLSSLFGKKSNPYTSAYHPGHNPLPKNTSARLPSSELQDQTNRNLLAEAREAVGRDPVTGQRRPEGYGYLPSEGNNPGHHPDQQTLSDGGVSLSILRQIEEEERTCYQSRAAKGKQVTGSKYDLLVKEALARRDAESRVRATRGGHEYYAPERAIKEFYSGGAQDE